MMTTKPTTPQVLVDHADGNFLITLPYHENWRIEELQKRWQPNTRRWIIPAGWRTAEHLTDKIHAKYWTDAAAAAADAAIQQRPAIKKELENVDRNFKTQPMAHQLEAYRKAYNQDQFALFFEQGLGKTKTAIDLASMWVEDGVIETVVALCPVSIRQVWQKEFEIHCGLKHTVRLMQTSGAISWGKDPGLRVLVVGIESLSQGKTYDLLVKLLPTLGAVAMIVDESSRAKNHKAIRTQRMVDLSSGCRKRLILTGTPVTQGIQDLYSQFQILNPETLGLKSFYAFRNRYCIEEPVRGAPPGVTKVIGYKNVEELLSLIEPWSLRKEKKDCLDLPDKTFQTRYVDLTKEQRSAYNSMKKNLIALIERDGKTLAVKAKMALEAYLRLQQIAGGFLPEIDPETRKTTGVYPIPGSNPKLNELIQLMDENPHPVVVMCRFRSELEAIATALKSTRSLVQFHGGLDEDAKKASVASFMEGRADVFIATLQSASYGLTLTRSSLMIYYSMGFSLEEFLQSQDRIHRIGQTLPCTYVSIAAASSIDQDIVDAIVQKKSIADMVSERIKNGTRLEDLL